MKILFKTFSIVLISEIVKRSSFIGALLASIPLISVLAMIRFNIDTKDVTKVSSLSTSVFWLVIPSLILFTSLPLFLKAGINFYLSISMAIALTALCYWLMIMLLNFAGIKL